MSECSSPTRKVGDSNAPSAIGSEGRGLSLASLIASGCVISR